MSKKTKILGAAVAVLALVIAGTVGMVATASAADPTPTASATTPQADVLARIAQILGIDQQKVTDAFTQARQEMAQTALDTALAKAVAEGRITQAEADQTKSWWGQRPEVLNKGVFPGLGRWGFGGRMRGGCFGLGTATQSATPSTT